MDEVFQRFLRQSGPVLCLDIGSVTQDVVLARSGVDTENWPRFVLPSPSQTIAQRIRELTLLRRDVWLYGAEMGGNFAPAVESCLKSGRNIYATRAAADSLDRNPAMVRQMGVVITEICPDGCVPVDLRDYSPQFWDNFLRSAGMPSRISCSRPFRITVFLPAAATGLRAGSISRNSCRRRHRPLTG